MSINPFDGPNVIENDYWKWILSKEFYDKYYPHNIVRQGKELRKRDVKAPEVETRSLDWYKGFYEGVKMMKEPK